MPGMASCDPRPHRESQEGELPVKSLFVIVAVLALAGCGVPFVPLI